MPPFPHFPGVISKFLPCSRSLKCDSAVPAGKVETNAVPRWPAAISDVCVGINHQLGSIRGNRRLCKSHLGRNQCYWTCGYSVQPITWSFSHVPFFFSPSAKDWLRTSAQQTLMEQQCKEQIPPRPLNTPPNEYHIHPSQGKIMVMVRKTNGKSMWISTTWWYLL